VGVGSVGCDADTAAFTVATLTRWWHGEGRARYPGARRLLITADAGGSNGYRVRAWSKHLAEFALSTGLDATVCRFPPGTSTWNKREHRLFSRISVSCRGRPLTSHEVVVALIGATGTATGLRVHAGRVRLRRLSHRRGRQRPGHGQPAEHGAPVARGMELHPACRTTRALPNGGLSQSVVAWASPRAAGSTSGMASLGL
jgi:hypothetical protein